jgi:hypothetical protein
VRVRPLTGLAAGLREAIEDDGVRILTAVGDRRPPGAAGGDRGRAVLVTEFSETRHRLNADIPIFAATALHARALVDGDDALLDRAVELYGGIPRPLVLAAALEDTGTVGHLDTALRLYEQAEAACHN